MRTEELLQADRYYCSSQYFSVAADYGFSKGLDEALQKWGNDDGRVFYDVVRVVRMTRPLVITSVFVGGPSDGHGNHAAAGLWAQKVFLAAGDPKVFPDQIKDGLRPWNPLKEYALVPFSLEEGYVSSKGLYDYANHRWDPAGVQNYISGKFEPGAVSATVEVPVGTYSVVNGLSDQQISRTGLGWQKSQNGGSEIPAAGPAESAYHRFGSRIPAADKENSFFDGIDISLQGIAGLAGNEEHAFLTQGLSTINGLVETAINNYSVHDPSAIAPTLAKGFKATNDLIDQVNRSSLSAEAKYNVLHELKIKQAQFNDALVLALGLSITANVTHEPPPPPPAKAKGGAGNDEERSAARLMARFRGDQPTFQMAIPGQQFPVLVHLAGGSPVSVKIDKVSLAMAGTDGSGIQAQGQRCRPTGWWRHLQCALRSSDSGERRLHQTLLRSSGSRTALLRPARSAVPGYAFCALSSGGAGSGHLQRRANPVGRGGADSRACRGSRDRVPSDADWSGDFCDHVTGCGRRSSG